MIRGTTAEFYDSAIDVEGAPFEYEETIEKPVEFYSG